MCGRTIIFGKMVFCKNICMKRIGLAVWGFCLLGACKGQSVQNLFDYKLEAGGCYTSGCFIPYYMVSNRHGIISPESGVGFLRAGAGYSRETSSGFRLGMGLDLVGYTAETSPYYDAVRLHQLYADISYKKVGMSVGMREESSMLVNGELSSGNMVWSENARPVPRMKIGTTDYVSVPGTGGWINFYFDFSYGWQGDGGYNREVGDFLELVNTDRRNYHITENVVLHRKNLFFRTKQDEKLVMTVGIEHASQFGGTVNGRENAVNLKDYAKVFLASTGNAGNEYSHLASIDVRADVNFRQGVLGAYTQLFMDEISRHGGFRQNGTDGLWGLEWRTGKSGFLSDVIVEYLKTTNQGGPVYANEEYKYDGKEYHYYACTYYDDQHYGAWSNFGMALGSPMLKSPIYNENRLPMFAETLVRALHIGMKGQLAEKLDYRFMFSYRKTWGTTLYLSPSPKENTSAMLECCYHADKGWTFVPSVAFDSGKLYGDNFGLALSVRKVGSFFKKQ